MEYNSGWNIIELSKINSKNYISIDGRDKFLTPVNEENSTGKGANSFVFQLNDYNEEEDPQIIKFCKYYLQKTNRFYKTQRLRFDREIEALSKVEKYYRNDFLVKIFESGTYKISGKVFKYYTMEKADCDLKTYLVDNPLTIDMKIQICFDLIEAFAKLHSLGIYHRDIKPDNIFFVDRVWKIGDLGLIKMRGEDLKIERYDEKIGPFGFLSPEALNKAIGNRGLVDFSFDCDIDDKSDVFQIGKVLWYIIQGEVPSGQLIAEDFKEKKILNVFETVIKPALQFAKNRRPSFNELKDSILPTCKELRII